MSRHPTKGYVSRYNRIPCGIAQYGFGEWDRALGNHRAIIRVSQAGEAAYAYLPWRRQDAFPQTKHVRVVDAQTGRTVVNSVVVTCNREYGEIVFEPVSGPGNYYAYYLVPTHDRHRWDWPRNAFPITLYESPHTEASRAWREKHHVRPEDIGSPPNQPAPLCTMPNPYPAPWRDLPEAELVEFQSRGEWHSFYPMEIIATLDERTDLIRRSGTKPFLLFPESRHRPIRMTKDIPYHWAARKTDELHCFKETALRNEYVMFQIGVYAHRESLLNVQASWSALAGPDGARIPMTAITCFNLEGTDQRGRRFSKVLHVAPKQVQALWFGVEIPRNARPGRYEGTVTLVAQGMDPQTVRLQIAVRKGILDDHGDGDHERLSRLRWLNSSHGLDDECCPPFIPVEVKGRSVKILGRTVELDESGLPSRMTSFIDMFRIRDYGRDVLAAPVRFEVVMDGSPVRWKTRRPASCRRKSSGKAHFESVQTARGITRRTGVTVEMDGRVGVRIALETTRAQALAKLCLVLELPSNVSRYWLQPAPSVWEVSGPTQLAFACPKSMDKPLQQFQLAWTGDYNAGLAFSIIGAEGGWLKGGEGRFQQKRSGRVCRIVLETGRLRMAAGELVTMEFALYLTPFKPLPAAHWDWRYYHEQPAYDLKLNQAIEAGARIFTQHQGSPANPYISYPFSVAERLRKIADGAHKAVGLFKAYHTVRELSTRANELWALRSLGSEILAEGPADLNPGFESLAQLPLEYQLRRLDSEPFTGNLWMCEHLVDDYHPRWHSQIKTPDGAMITEDSSVHISGSSRWSNFYVEGLRWLMAHAGVDGLYLDGATFDRESFLRVRKTLVRQKPQALIDFHDSPAEAMDYLGFIDSIWFGEGADYNREDAYWLIAVSGIPFGVPGELLGAHADVHRGMLYGLSHRCGWAGDRANPSALWKWWDAFEINNAEMLGYWMPNCPVQTDHPAVKATAYVQNGRRLAIVIASWAPHPVAVQLRIDWEAVGLAPAAVRVAVPEIARFQLGMASVSLASIPIEPNCGCLVVVEKSSAS